MKRWRVLFSLLALSLMLVMPAMAADYDLVINNGRVMDPETKYDAVANVGIKDGKIAVITKRQDYRQGDHRRQRVGGSAGIYRWPPTLY